MFRNYKNNILLLFVIISLSVIPKINAVDTISKYEEELEKVKEEQQENAKNLTGVERELALYSYDVADIDSQIVEYSKNIAGIDEQKKEVEETLASLQEQLTSSQEDYSVLNSSYARRLRSMYENGIPNIFELIITSNGFTDLMIKLNLYSMILDHDKSIMNSYQDKQNYINYITKDIELDKKQLESLEQSLTATKTELETKRQEKVEKMDKLYEKQSELQDLSASLTEKRKKAMEDIDAEVTRVIEELARQIANGTATTFTGTDFAYPVPGFTTITTRFGEIYNLVDPAGSAHTGADIAGYEINCTPIYAIQKGTVTTATYSNYGYGNYIIINHGQCLDDNSSYISLYGHCSSLVVEPGQEVEKGELIGYVGTTGNSTGPHLHLELRINGERVDPLQLYPSINFTFV